jgi:hypothetical protein
MDSRFAHSSVNRSAPPCSSPGEEDRKILPIVGSPFSQWDTRNDGDRIGQPSRRGGPTLKGARGPCNDRPRLLQQAHRSGPSDLAGDSEIARQAYLLEPGRQHAHRGRLSSFIAWALVMFRTATSSPTPPPNSMSLLPHQGDVSSSAFDVLPVRGGMQAKRVVPQ